jgi:hypothetical protein
MKSQIKLLVAIALTGLPFTNSKAQTNSSNEPHFGIKEGVNFSNIIS